MEFDKKIINEKILTNNFLQDINYYLSEIYNIEDKIKDLLNKDLEVENPIEDLNDVDRQILSLDGEIDFNYSNLNKGNGYLNFEKRLLEEDMKNLIDDYNLLLLNLLISIDNSIGKLKLKSNDFYRLYYKTSAHKILNFDSTSFKYQDLDYYLRLKEDFNNLKDTCENNPYKIILNTYLYYIDIIKVYSENIEKNFDDIYKQASIVKTGLPINLNTFENLKKWEESIEVSEFISIYKLTK